VRNCVHRGCLLIVLIGAVVVAAWADPPILRVGMDTRSRPWAFVPGLEYTTEDWLQAPKISPAQVELLQGSDIDVMKALAKRMNMVAKVVPVSWVHIEEALVAKQLEKVNPVFEAGDLPFTARFNSVEIDSGTVSLAGELTP